MKTKQEIFKSALSIYHELKETEPSDNLKKYLQTKLETYIEVLDNDLSYKIYEMFEEVL